MSLQVKYPQLFFQYKNPIFCLHCQIPIFETYSISKNLCKQCVLKTLKQSVLCKDMNFNLTDNIYIFRYNYLKILLGNLKPNVWKRYLDICYPQTGFIKQCPKCKLYISINSFDEVYFCSSCNNTYCIACNKQEHEPSINCLFPIEKQCCVCNHTSLVNRANNFQYCVNCKIEQCSQCQKTKYYIRKYELYVSINPNKDYKCEVIQHTCHYIKSL